MTFCCFLNPEGEVLSAFLTMTVNSSDWLLTDMSKTGRLYLHVCEIKACE